MSNIFIIWLKRMRIRLFRKRKCSEWRKSVLRIKKIYTILPTETRRDIFPRIENILLEINIPLSSNFRARKRYFNMLDKKCNIIYGNI